MTPTATGGRLPTQRAPRLVLRFVVVTAIGLVLAGVGVAVVVDHAIARQTERQAVSRVVVATHALLDRQLLSSDLARRPSVARQQQLRRLFSARSLGADTLGATLYSRSGVVFSSVPGRRQAVDPGLVERARAGRVISTVSSTDSGPILRTFLPLGLTNGATGGVVEVDQSYAPIADAARNSALVVAAILEGLLLVLIVLLVPVLSGAAARLRDHLHELDAIASHDELTGLLNRAGFRRSCEQALAAPHAAGAMLVVDVERFREVNETIGSENGDRLLAEVASRLRGAFPERAVARIGEDEFGVLLTARDRSRLDEVVDGVRGALRAPFFVDGIEIGLEVRCGAAEYPEHGSDFDSLVHHAGLALSRAAEVREPLAVYLPDPAKGDLARLRLKGELRQALGSDQLLVYYQPQADLATRSIRGVEALVRWRHPTRGLLSAGEFIQTAEQSGIISELGRFVLSAAVEQWREWKRDGLTIDMAVNLSTVDLLDLTLPSTITDLLIEHGMPAEYLVLEITERTLLHDEQQARKVLRQLDRIGVRLSIDDYGTGYSSLAMLKRLPVQQVKIDRSFVSGIPGDHENDEIVRSTVQLAHILGATVVAEGIETSTELNRLAVHGCDIGQGYLIGHPLPADQLAALLRARRPTADSPLALVHAVF